MYRMGGIDNTTKYATHKGNCITALYKDNCHRTLLKESERGYIYSFKTIFGHGGRHWLTASAGTLLILKL